MGNGHLSSNCCECWHRTLQSGSSTCPAQEHGTQPVAGNSSAAVAEALLRLDEVYDGNSSNESYGSLHIHSDAALLGHGVTYGELMPQAVAAMLNLVGAKPGERYYDLGSGTGKTVVLSWLLGLDAWGVELVRERWETSCDVRNRMVQEGASDVGNLHFLHADLLEVDFSDADIVFANSLMFPRNVLAYIGRIARRMRPGARIVTDAEGHVGDGLALVGPGLRLVQKVKLPTTWASSSWFAIQEVIGDAESPTGSKREDQSQRKPKIGQKQSASTPK